LNWCRSKILRNWNRRYFDFNPNKEQVEKIQKQDRDIIASKEKFMPPITKYLDKDGKATYLETIKTPIIEDNNTSSNVLGFSINVTEKMELQNRAEEAMNKLLTAVTDVTSKIEDILKQAKDEQLKLVELSKKQIEQEKAQALSSAKSELTDIITTATEKILRQKLDDKKDKDLITKSLSSLK
jgi:vacuolar-type H+-ATPase subunit H